MKNEQKSKWRQGFEVTVGIWSFPLKVWGLQGENGVWRAKHWVLWIAPQSATATIRHRHRHNPPPPLQIWRSQETYISMLLLNFMRNMLNTLFVSYANVRLIK